MSKGIVAALFAALICSQIDQAFFDGRYSQAAFHAALEIRHGFGF